MRHLHVVASLLPCRRARSTGCTLRLLADPVHRYADPAAELLDGGIFLFAFGSHPDVILLVEPRRQGSSRPAWHYALARLVSSELSVSLDGRQVWKQPDTKPNANETYWYFSGPPYWPQEP